MNTLSALNQASKDHRKSGASNSSRHHNNSSGVANIPLYRFAKPSPAKRSSSSSSASDTESDSGHSGLSRTSSINSNSSTSSGATSPSLTSPSSEKDYDEFTLKQDIRRYCVGTQTCKCEGCLPVLGDFIFESEAELEEYVEILQAAKAIGFGHTVCAGVQTHGSHGHMKGGRHGH